MPKFAYSAETVDGLIQKGTQSANTLGQAQLKLAARNLRVTTLAPKKGVNLELSKKKVKRVELMNLSRQLAAFLQAGVPLLDSINLLAEETDRVAVRRVLTDIEGNLRAGLTLSEAVERFPKDFPPFYRGILRSAELTGRLDTVLDQLSGYLERDLEARRKVKGAMMYPAVIAVLAVVTVVILSVFVLPKFKLFFASLGTDLPLPTRMLLATTTFMQSWWWALIGGLAVATVGYLLGMRRPSVRRLRDGLVLRLPVVGVTVRYAVVERFTRLLASMTAAGVPLPEAMSVATGSLRNLVFERGLTTARRLMIDGAGLAGPVAASRLFPPVVTQMIRVGEETGTLDRQLEVAATYYARELDYKIQKLTTLIEPMVMLVMGGIVGFVAIALVSAMYGGLNSLGT
jgi:type IV pilus assembly protein PilC